MRKTTFVSTLCSCIFHFCPIASGILCLSAFAQDSKQETAPAPSAAAALPSDPAAFMHQAALSNGLSQAGDRAWHMKASFEIFDEQGSAKDHGTLEEFYISPTRFKSVYSSSGYSHTVYGTGKGMMYAGDQTGPSALLRTIRTYLISPLPTDSMMARVAFAAEQRTYSGASHLCILMSTKPKSDVDQPRLIATFCFNPATLALQSARLDTISETLDHPISFQGRSVSSDLKVETSGKINATAHLEIIEPITAIDEAVFIPPPDASAYEIMMVGVKGDLFGSSPNLRQSADSGQLSISPGLATGMLVTKVAPEYPPIAKAARVQGTVVLEAVISKDGQIKNLRVISGPPMLQQAALDAVKTWTYRPYLLNGEPAEVRTTINVIFTLGNPPNKDPRSNE